jgi:predicted alpha/beta superfamily hydrolase
MTTLSASDERGWPARLTLPDVWSPQLRNRRDVDVYLPASYPDRRRHPVIYMQDGQNLSDPSIAFAETWRLGSVFVELAAAASGGPKRGAGVGAAVEPIVVGVHNHEERLAEYSPFPSRKHGGGRADDYLAFLVRTLKPRIDRQFRTRRRASQTAIVGSSMGALVSLYAWFRHPDMFALAGVMSPALWYGRERLFEFVERSPMPAGRLYLDVGTGEGATALRDTRSMWSLLINKPSSDDSRLLYLEDRGGRHNEAAWGGRLARALEFLLRE